MRATNAANRDLPPRMIRRVRTLKAASEILDLGDASRLLRHTDERITETVYRRAGGDREANPMNPKFGRVAVTAGNDAETISRLTESTAECQKHKSPASAGLSFESWRETRDSNPGNAINVRRFSRPICKIKRAGTLEAIGVPLLAATNQATGHILQGLKFWFGNCFFRSH